MVEVSRSSIQLRPFHPFPILLLDILILPTGMLRTTRGERRMGGEVGGSALRKNVVRVHVFRDLNNNGVFDGSDLPYRNILVTTKKLIPTSL